MTREALWIVGGVSMRALPVLLIIAVAATAQAAPSAPSPDTIHVPLPSDADAGRFVVTSLDDEPRTATFVWSADPYSDAWGRTIEGYSVAFSELGGGSSCTLSATNGEEAIARSSTESLGYFLNYSPGVARPAVYGGELVGCVAGALIGSEGVSGTGGTMRTDYVSWKGFTCLFRNDLQDRDIVAGTTIERGCEPLDGGGSWQVGELGIRDGFRVLSLTHVEDLDAKRRVERLWLADGLAYPFERSSITIEEGNETANTTYRLVALATEGSPLATGPTPIDPAQPVFALDPLLGPDDADARLPIRLSDAARSATSDPTLTALQALLARDGAALADATLESNARAAGSPVVDPRWTLVYAAPNTAPVIVTCGGAPATLPGAPAVVRCTNGSPSSSSPEIPSSFDARALPATSASFRDALARLEAHDANATSRPITFAQYRAWSDEFSAPAIAIGDTTVTAPSAVSSAASDPGTITEIDLETGKARYDFGQARAPVVVDNLPDGIEAGDIRGSDAAAPDRATRAPALKGNNVALTATVAAIGFLILLAILSKSAIAAFFTRLLRPKVLDAETRASIHELVQARPGIHLSEIIQHFDRGTGLIEYHLDVLVREGFLAGLKTTGFRHYFVAGRFSAGEMRALAALRQGQAERLYRLIEANPGIHMQALAEQAGLSAGYVSKEIKRLNEAGLVDQVKVGRAVRLHALER